MAKNAPYGNGHRQGQVTERSQVHNPHNDRLLSFPRPIGERVRVSGQCGSWTRRRIRNHLRV